MVIAEMVGDLAIKGGFDHHLRQQPAFTGQLQSLGRADATNWPTNSASAAEESSSVRLPSAAVSATTTVTTSDIKCYSIIWELHHCSYSPSADQRLTTRAVCNGDRVRWCFDRSAS